MGRFVISQTLENNAVVQTSRSLKFLKRDFLKTKYLPLEWTLRFVTLLMPKHTHYTLTKIQKVKKHNRTPLTYWQQCCQ